MNTLATCTSATSVMFVNMMLEDYRSPLQCLQNFTSIRQRSQQCRTQTSWMLAHCHHHVGCGLSSSAELGMWASTPRPCHQSTKWRSSIYWLLLSDQLSETKPHWHHQNQTQLVGISIIAPWITWIGHTQLANTPANIDSDDVSEQQDLLYQFCKKIWASWVTPSS